jgi:predicted ATPase/DNA-binding CsgD family transcriptional regulator
MDVTADPIIQPTRNSHSLTHARTSFVGRSEALEKVVGLLGEYRLVTVTGPGGVGKTRLADEALKRVGDQFADGVWVVELAAVHEPALVPAMVATVLGVRQAAGMSIVEAIAAWLSHQQVLLVLDNCEHVLDAVVQLCEAILVGADDIKVLATSREPLGLPEEVRYRLSPLMLPGRTGRAHTDQSEAVTLFVERAHRIDPDLAFDDSSGALVRRLVQRLDGMPLAIELAAARVEALGLAQLFDRLDDRFRLLISANRAADARQRSLEAAVDWSYQLLSEAERHVFRHVSVFPGPFTLEAAEAVAGPGTELEVLRLVDCSLLVPPRTGPDGRSRYAMLETLRDYGVSRLQKASEEYSAASALATYALGVAERAAAQMGLRDREHAAALWLDAEDASVHQALGWAITHDTPAALRLALALAPWWMVRGRWLQGYDWLNHIVTQTDCGEHWSTAYLRLGDLAREASDLSSALEHYNAVVDALRAGPPSADFVDGLTGKSAALRNTGHLPEAEAEARAALRLARQIGYTTGTATSLYELSLLSAYAGNGEQAIEWGRQAQQVDQDQLPGWHSRLIERLLPGVLATTGRPPDLDEARNLAMRALARARAAGDLGVQVDLLHVLLELDVRTARLTEASVHLRETAELAVYLGGPLRLIDLLDEAGHLCTAIGRHADAITLWSAMVAQNLAAGLADTPEGAHRRTVPLEEARRALGTQQVQIAKDRGAAMPLAAAVEFAVMATDSITQQPPTPTGAGTLSARERELVALVAQGKTDAEIAGQLFISVSTVRTHLDRIRQKSGCRRRADLTRLALQEGII